MSIGFRESSQSVRIVRVIAISDCSLQNMSIFLILSYNNDAFSKNI